MFDSLSGAEILTIAVIALVVFGPGRLPDIARTIGRYLRELKAAVTDLRQGIEEEIGPLRDPIKEIKQDLAKPVSDVRRTLTETADAAKSVERDIKRSAKGPVTGTTGATGTAGAAGAGGSAGKVGAARKPDASGTGGTDATAPQARWIAPEPPTGVSPSEVWEGMGDPIPGTVHPPSPPGPPADKEDDAKVAGAETNEAPPDDKSTEQDGS